MSLRCETGPRGRHEVVISENAAAKEAHKALFRFDDDAYRVSPESLFDSLRRSVADGALRIHVSGGWEWMLRLALWKDGRPSRGEVFFLLKGLGLGDDDLRPFSSSDCNDIFHCLYYGQRFDVLRRLCGKASEVSQARAAADAGVRISCHLVAEDAGLIVASSL
ncbi:MAG TPA: hypothetical protein ENJ04_00610 [Nitrospirae bacterium]|nr:hypothetical protein [Nitrospirota bacterium]